jgi:2-polyprenyl-6-hydroxyphenyl methylase/3-demethylubiquinone-9 3-methyltransferase
MTTSHEAIVASRFDALHARFNHALAPEDARLRGIIGAMGPLAGLRVLDLGCGKGRFARALIAEGADVIGVDLSRLMLNAASGLERVQAKARQLPFQSSSFDAVLAVEVLEHIEPRSLDAVLTEARRVLRAAGRFVAVDKNVYSWNARRTWLPSVVLKWIDEHRGRWMYSPADKVRERWFRPAGMRRRLERWFPDVEVVHLTSRSEEKRFPFHFLPGTRLFVMWAARAPGGSR